ncbi:hypothetical protein K227x_28220 [Rubripirellula lacrimiformis]|uniref:Xylosidase/arabinosidase n=1 Tax=Rubripirellula lacrimiformis TaxID=1930273 RepID=A0A517NBC3_9BACT|nr:glycoside hydrolase family 71/99-like protein [Rubripirellula lacrimiformis]QDT04431.1 hypothetical protein K227x_28220 [Rubripirellula lacrimiformis]
MIRISSTLLCLSWSLVAFAVDDPKTVVVDRSTLTGKVMCGYQGWFNCDGDGADLGWTHWSRDRRNMPGPGNVVVDLWPDLTEYGPDERFATGFRMADGRAAEVFSSGNRKTVLRHFQWMQQYGIDGAFLQRFASGLRRGPTKAHKDRVLKHVRDGANLSGRAFAVMYDLSGIRADDTELVQDDWRSIEQEMRLADDAAYLHHEGKPVVAIWGIGFNDDRPYSLNDCHELVRWFKEQGCTVMVGVPSFWRTLQRDSVDDLLLHQIIELADIVSPWSVGRYRSADEATRHAADVWAADQQWCQQRQLDFLPVVFPGFSWHNLKGADLAAIPRRKGEFLWSQIVAAKNASCQMIYVAMFDEVDEGTAIFKCTDEPPTGDGVQFLDFEGLPSDFYLKMVGQAGKLLRDEIPIRPLP